MTTRFEWKGRGGGPNAEALGHLYARLERRDGVVLPERVVEESKDPDAPTHGMFEWDDAEAGHRWRVHQARLYLGHLVIVVGEQKSRIVNVTVLRRGEPVSGYLDMRKASEDAQAMQKLAHDCYATLKGWRERAGEIGAFKGVWDAFDEVDPPE